MIGRVLFFVFVCVPVLIVGIPIQALFAYRGWKGWHTLPRYFHKFACMFLGLRVEVIGTPSTSRPTLLLANHISWTDVFAIGSVADMTFVAREEMSDWPVVGIMATLQRSIFVHRTKKTTAGRSTSEMADRLADGGAVLLFAEGHSDVGTHVLPFRTALVGAAQQAMMEAGAREVAIQPVTIAYTRLAGLPVSRSERSLIAWIRSKTVWQNIVDILRGGYKEVVVVFGIPHLLAPDDDRKEVTRNAENDVRRMLVALNRSQPLPAVE